MRKIISIIPLSFLAMIFGCSHGSTKDDPLKNTKRLMQEGHESLYENGAFQVPNTHLYLIPPGPDPISLAADSLLPKAKASLSKALDAAADTVTIVADGTKITYHLSDKISTNGKKARETIQSMMRPSAKLIILKSGELGKELIGKSWQVGEKAGIQAEEVAVGLAKSRKSVEGYRQQARQGLSKGADDLQAQAQNDVDQANHNLNSHWQDLSKNWILGRAATDQKIAKNNSDYESKKSLERFTRTYEDTEKFRQENSDRLHYFMNGSFSEGQKEATGSYKNAGQVWDEDSKENGYTLSAVRALGWLLKGTLWDSAIVPLSKTVFGGVGYLYYNGIAYPVMITSKQGYNSALLAVEYSSLKAGNGYEYVAPTGQAALAGVIASAKYIGGISKAGVTKASAVGVETGGVAIAETVAAIGKAGLYVGEKSVHLSHRRSHCRLRPERCRDWRSWHNEWGDPWCQR